MSENKSVTVNFITGISGALAAGLSYVTNHSFWWAVLHFFCGWIYVIYNLFAYGLPHLPTR